MKCKSLPLFIIYALIALYCLSHIYQLKVVGNLHFVNQLIGLSLSLGLGSKVVGLRTSTVLYYDEKS